MEQKEISTHNYGLCLFSMDKMKAFLKEEGLISRKPLVLLQKSKNIFLNSIKTGAWVPIPEIDSGHYALSVDGFDEPFDDSWEELFSYDGFNLEVANGIWVSDTGSFLDFDPTDYEGEGREIKGAYGTVQYNSSTLRWQKDMAGSLSNSDIWYDLPAGKYLVSIRGYARKDAGKEPRKAGELTSGFRFSFVKTDDFKECRNPRESDDYEFNVEWLRYSYPGKVCWLPKKESGIMWPIREPRLKASIALLLEDGRKCNLNIKFDSADTEQEGVTHCRVTRGILAPKDFSLESGKEYTIYECTRSRGKDKFKELGKLLLS
ncbi:MAG: hypothetical protein J5752_00675 [Clostridiales bacterium]|nr:hypothetical protein [Clostridiales bacterium]